MILGVDRSHLNSKVSLASLKAKGITFIYFKATQADAYVDPTFDAAWKEAKTVPGLYRGCYHFFDPRIDGIVQATHYLSQGVVFGATGCLPPCVDVEDLVGASRSDTAKINKWVADNWQLSLQRLGDFLNYVETKTDRDCLIYTYNNYPKEYYHGHGFPNNPMWLSSLQKTCPVRYDTGRLPEFWQNTYGWNGTDMDGDFFTGTIEQLNKLANL
jgi:lysozyme